MAGTNADRGLRLGCWPSQALRCRGFQAVLAAALIWLAAAQPAAAQSTHQRSDADASWQTMVSAAREDASAPKLTDGATRNGDHANRFWPDAERTRFVAGAARFVQPSVAAKQAQEPAHVLSTSSETRVLRTPSETHVLSTPANMALIGFAGLLMVSFLSALRFAVAAPIAGMRAITDRSSRRGRGQQSRPGGDKDDERAACDDLLERASALWTFAEAAVLRLDTSTPLRSLLMKELQQVTQRLSKVAETSPGRGHMINANLPDEYWKLLRQRLRRTISDLERIWRTAEAAQETIGDRTHEPRIPSNRDEALLVLGASSDIDSATLQRLVRALRQCWHPDLAQSESDRTFRGARIAQINVAYDILSGRRAEA